jgi:hypothetical protein
MLGMQSSLESGISLKQEETKFLGQRLKVVSRSRAAIYELHLLLFQSKIFSNLDNFCPTTQIFPSPVLPRVGLLSVCGSTALVDLGRFFNFLIYAQSVGLLGRGISPSQDRYLHTE